MARPALSVTLAVANCSSFMLLVQSPEWLSSLVLGSTTSDRGGCSIPHLTGADPGQGWKRTRFLLAPFLLISFRYYGRGPSMSLSGLPHDGIPLPFDPLQLFNVSRSLETSTWRLVLRTLIKQGSFYTSCVTIIFLGLYLPTRFLLTSHQPCYRGLSLEGKMAGSRSLTGYTGGALLLAARLSSALNFTVSNGQIYTPGLVIVDAPQPGTPLGGGLSLSSSHLRAEP
jgi:hypothetical protein